MEDLWWLGILVGWVVVASVVTVRFFRWEWHLRTSPPLNDGLNCTF
ncbi:MAG: hypothetical protein IMY77_03860 [Chloroflexi bacterium]|nr:hypothetical protein [Chloroflexota bacterium]